MEKFIDDIMTNVPPYEAHSSEDRIAEIRSAKGVVKYDALVLDARLRQSLVAVRSLGRHGKNVAALEVSNNAVNVVHVPSFFSHWCQQRYIAPSFREDSKPYLMYLLQVLDNIGARVLITSSDSTMALIREHREIFERRVCVALAKESALKMAINKDQTLEIARHLGLGVPRSVIVKAENEVLAAIYEIGLPAVVKPCESWLWGKNGRQAARLVCQLVTTQEEARRAVAELTRCGGQVLLQQFLSGKREAVSFLYANGQMYARFAQWAKRTQPPLGGTSVYRQSIALPEDIGYQAERLVREIELEGYSEVEFRRDRAGKAYLMEINPRLSASVEIAVRAGVDFPYLLYQWANGDRISRVESYRTGVWMRYLGGDIIATGQALRQHGRPGVDVPLKALLDFFLSFFTPTNYDYIEWRDPLPALAATISFIHEQAGNLLAER